MGCFLIGRGGNNNTLLDFMCLNLLKNKTLSNSFHFIFYIVKLLALFEFIINIISNGGHSGFEKEFLN